MSVCLPVLHSMYAVPVGARRGHYTPRTGAVSRHVGDGNGIPGLCKNSLVLLNTK